MAKKYIDGMIKKFSDLFKSDSTKRSEKIDEQISIKKSEYLDLTYEVLIMGPPRSGKSTFFQQLKRLYNEGNDMKTRIERRKDIRKYVVDSIMDILTATSLPVTSLKNLAVAKWLMYNLKNSNLECFERRSNLPKQFFNFPNFFNILWQNEIMKRHLWIYGECELKDNLEYFFNRIDAIFNDDYIPTDQDILRCPVFSANIKEIKIKLNVPYYIFIDIGRERNKVIKSLPWKRKGGNSHIDIYQRLRKKYIIMFTMDLSSPEKLHSSLVKLEEIAQSCYNFCDQIFIILCKVDVFKKRIRSGESLESFFWDFPDFTTFFSDFISTFRTTRPWEMGEDISIIASIRFIAQKVKSDCRFHNHYEGLVSIHVLSGTILDRYGILSDVYIKQNLADLEDLTYNPWAGL